MLKTIKFIDSKKLILILKLITVIQRDDLNTQNNSFKNIFAFHFCWIMLYIYMHTNN